MTKSCRAYVLVTCLYLLALLSISGLTALHLASVMAQQTRLLDATGRGLQEAQGSLRVAEAALLRGELLGVDSVAAAVGCETSTDARVRVNRLHERWISGVDGDGEVVAAIWVVYGIQACQNGRAVLETTLGVVEPIGVFDESALPPKLKPGRLSWRRVW